MGGLRGNRLLESPKLRLKGGKRIALGNDAAQGGNRGIGVVDVAAVGHTRLTFCGLKCDVAGTSVFPGLGQTAFKLFFLALAFVPLERIFASVEEGLVADA